MKRLIHKQLRPMHKIFNIFVYKFISTKYIFISFCNYSFQTDFEILGIFMDGQGLAEKYVKEMT